MKNIYNAKIKKWWMRRNKDDINEPVLLNLEVNSIKGTAVLPVKPIEFDKLFKILEIDDIKDLNNAPCVALVTNGYIRTIGNFMFWDKSVIYSNKEKVDELNSEDWLDYDTYLEYYDDTEKI